MIKGQSLWNYYHAENAWPIVHAFNSNNTDNVELKNNPILKQKLLDIASVEHNNHLRGGIVNIVGQSEISWLIAMSRLNYRYAVMWFDGCWSSTHDINLELLNEIDRINDFYGKDNWIVAGNILIEDNHYAHLGRNIVIINLDTWSNYTPQDPADVMLRQPVWAKYSTNEVSPDMPVEDLWSHYESGIVEDFEDSAFGLQRLGPIMGDIKEVMFERTMTHEEFDNRYHNKICNPLLTYALFEELYVPGLSDTFMNTLTYIKPHIGSDELEKAIQGQSYDESAISYQANKLIKDMFAPTSPIYFVNTEPSEPDTAEEIEDTYFDQYVGATAGFKLFYYAYKYGFTTDTKFILYDFDPLSCKFKRDLLEQWDGINYPEFVDAWIEQNPDANDNLRDLTLERWPMVIQQFGGEEEWLETWYKIQSSDWEVVECDLIYGHDILFEKLENKRTLMWTSNIYSYIIPKMLAQPFALEISFIDLITKLNSLDNDCWFSGTDINDNDLMCPVRAIFSTTNNETLTFEQ